MAWNGWIQWGGVEIVNASRTEQYAVDAPWFHSIYNNEDLGVLFDENYTNPVMDDAAWIDPDNEDLNDFYGCYPLDIVGLEDSTSTSQVIEGVLDGGVVGTPRLATRTIVFSLALVGASEAAVESGFRWLKSAVTNAPCSKSSRSCVGDSLCFLSSPPMIDRDGGGWPSGIPMMCLPRWQRTILNVGITVGPTVLSKMVTSSGGCAWIVTMTAVAGNPYIYGAQTDLVRHFMSPNVTDPYVHGAPDGAEWDSDGIDQQDPNCWIPTYQPLSDPNCPSVILPPDAPSLNLDCFSFPVNYHRTRFSIPEQLVPLWGEVVPKLEIHTSADDVRKVRVRFYADVKGAGDPSLDPCAFCGDIVFSYIPANSSLIFDGVDETIYVQTKGGPLRRADALVFGSDGLPFEWPQLTCGYSYIVTVDMPLAQPKPTFDLSLFARSA